jgi:hypothetical protein
MKKFRGLRLWLAAVVALIFGSGLPGVPALAQTAPEPTPLDQQCVVIPAVTQAVQAGLPAAGVGETVRAAQQLHLDSGTINQDILVRPDGSTYVASTLVLHSLDPAGTTLVPNSTALTINGLNIPLVAGTGPQVNTWVVNATADPSGIGTRFELFLPGDAAALTSGDAAPSYVVPAGGADIEFSVAFVLNDGPTVTNGKVFDLATCEGRLALAEGTRSSDTATASVAVAEPKLTIDKVSVNGSQVTPGALTQFEINLAVPAFDPDTLFTNGSAFDVVVTDAMPADLDPVDAAGDPRPTVARPPAVGCGTRLRVR